MAASSASVSDLSGLAIALAAPNLREQQAQGDWRHAVDAARLTDRARPHGFELLPDLGRQTAELRIVDSFRKLESLIAAERNNVGRLPVEIDRVFGIDLQLRRDLGRQGVE